jgi:hypothetical protein
MGRSIARVTRRLIDLARGTRRGTTKRGTRQRHEWQQIGGLGVPVSETAGRSHFSYGVARYCTQL